MNKLDSASVGISWESRKIRVAGNTGNLRIAIPEALGNPSFNGRLPFYLLCDVIHRTGQSAKGIPVPITFTTKLKQECPFRSFFLALEKLAFEYIAGIKPSHFLDNVINAPSVDSVVA